MFLERREINQGEEQLSFNSDQPSWDDYQEKYQSEAYSEEPADSDTAKKLLDFGEDYAKFLEVQSDGPTCIKMKKGCRSNKFDSDSDVDEVKRFLKKSMDKMILVEKMLYESNSDRLTSYYGGHMSDDESFSKSFLVG